MGRRPSALRLLNPATAMRSALRQRRGPGLFRNRPIGQTAGAGAAFDTGWDPVKFYIRTMSYCSGLIDGSADSERRLRQMLFWDVNNGIARRAWARNPHALSTIRRTMREHPGLQVTVPFLVEEEVVRAAIEQVKV